MGERLWIAMRRFWHRRRSRSPRVSRGAPVRIRCSPVWTTLILGLILAGVLICILELRLRPVVAELAVHQVDNEVTRRLNDVILADLAEQSVAYEDLMSVQRDADGRITAMSSNMNRLNQLRGRIVDVVLDTVQQMDVHELGIPLGSIFDLDLLWAKGPLIHVRSLVAGTVTAQADSRFESAGINQTMHSVYLNVSVPLSVLLPGSRLKTQVDLSVCVAETVIVGSVPDTFLQLSGAG